MSDTLEVKSELYDEDGFCNRSSPHHSNTIFFLQFFQTHESVDFSIKSDDDEDVIVPRKKYQTIEIECSPSTSLSLVGLQLWRGAFVLADFILSNHVDFSDKTILEVGSGVGFTSIVASMFAKEVICTDIEDEGLLDMIKRNIKRNEHIIKSKVSVLPLDFYSAHYSEELTKKLDSVDIILAADVIYDNDLTEAFVKTLIKLLNTPKKKKFYIALEKRYVFTLADMDTVAPCYEHFLSIFLKASRRSPMCAWRVKEMNIDFEQRFKYERSKHLVMWEIIT